VRTAGRSGLASAISNNIEMARFFAHLIHAEPALELVSAGPLSIVRFRYAPATLRDEPRLLDRLNRILVREIQQRGGAFFTSTRFLGRETMRACLVNYMTNKADIRIMIEEIRHAIEALALPME